MIGDWIITISNGYYTKVFEEEHRFNDEFSDAIIFKNKTHDEVQKFAEKKLNGIKTCWKVVSYTDALNAYNEKTFVNIGKIKYKMSKYLNIERAIRNVNLGDLVCCEHNGVKTVWSKDTLPENIKTDLVLSGVFRILSLA